MYLLLGHPEDPCCAGVAVRLDDRGHDVRIVETCLAPPANLTWRLDRAGVTSSLYPGVPDNSVAGVFVRDAGWLDPAGWDVDDHAYMQAELRAVTLAWLAGLSCPVINRPDAALWYRAGAPFVTWRSRLRSAGLPLPEVVITSDRSEAAAFRRRLAADGVNGAVYSPLSGAAGYLLTDDDAWERLGAVQERTPVCLIEPHGAATLACVVGDEVVWAGTPPPHVLELETALGRFAATAGLTFVEIAVAPVRGGLAVVLVEPRPRLEHFDEPVRGRILDAVVARLTSTHAASLQAPLVWS